MYIYFVLILLTSLLSNQVGSGMPETYELKVLLEYIQQVSTKFDREIMVPDELKTLIDNMTDALDELDKSEYKQNTNFTLVPHEMFQYWNRVATAREAYRNSTEAFSGKLHTYSSIDAYNIVKRWSEQVDLGIARALVVGCTGDGTEGISPTYFAFNVTKWRKTGERNEEGQSFVDALEMTTEKFPLFLEGVVRRMKTVDADEARCMYLSVKASGLRDETLGMYTLSSSLVGQSYDMGRMMAFAAGWLENQSIWMHMSYKYYLQLLKHRMYNLFFEEMKTGMLPFINGEVYGRSLLECSSFITSSAFNDPASVGRGYLARLSGSTAEFLSIWRLMFIGHDPFILNDEGSVEMQLIPALPLWLFEDLETDAEGKRDDDGNLVVSFKLFASIVVTYHNTIGTDLYDVSPTKYFVTKTDGCIVAVKGTTIPTETAIQIRKMLGIEAIDVYF